MGSSAIVGGMAIGIFVILSILALYFCTARYLANPRPQHRFVGKHNRDIELGHGGTSRGRVRGTKSQTRSQNQGEPIPLSSNPMISQERLLAALPSASSMPTVPQPVYTYPADFSGPDGLVHPVERKTRSASSARQHLSSKKYAGYSGYSNI
jgi:hypothetical protein